jgi:hypothetical protein
MGRHGSIDARTARRSGVSKRSGLNWFGEFLEYDIKVSVVADSCTAYDVRIGSSFSISPILFTREEEVGVGSDRNSTRSARNGARPPVENACRKPVWMLFSPRSFS